VVVGNRDIFWTCLCPAEAESPLVVYSDAVLSGTVAAQILQAISWWYAKIAKNFCGVKNRQFAQGDPLKISVELANRLSPPYAFGVPIAERLQHD